MGTFEWNDTFSVNVKEIDEQHKVLLGMINKLHDAASAGTDAHREIIHGILDYAKSHFATEEKYMHRFHYPDYHVHRSEHRAFAEKAQELKERLEHDALILTLELSNFLRDWLRGHILGSDKRYASHFNEHGLT